MNSTQNLKVTSVAELGLLLRAVRKLRRMRQDELARDVNVGHVFVRDVEHGKPTVQMGRALKLLEALGLELRVTVSEEVVKLRDELAARSARKAAAASRPAE